LLRYRILAVHVEKWLLTLTYLTTTHTVLPNVSDDFVVICTRQKYCVFSWVIFITLCPLSPVHSEMLKMSIKLREIIFTFLIL
jgi:hypothetical protein